jgi:small multidrug resistance family-3 protein
VKTFALYSVTALAEILGCYGAFLWLRHGKPVWWAIVAVVSLGIFAWLLTLHPFANAGRVYAAYGGVYIAASLLWLWLIEKQTPAADYHPGRKQGPRRIFERTGRREWGFAANLTLAPRTHGGISGEFVETHQTKIVKKVDDP